MSNNDALKRILKREREARKRAEQVIESKSRELWELNQSLEEKVKVRTEELERSNVELTSAKEKALESTRAKSEFLSNMSHEIRTPLNVIIGLAQVLRSLELEERPSEIVQNINHSADSLLMLVNDILDLSAIESGRISFEKVDFELPYLCKRLKETFKHKAGEKGNRLQLSLDDDIPQCVIGDPTKLNQILTNLIGNAIKFTEKGKIKVNIELGDASDDSCTLLFEVEDTGVGIEQDKLEVIFEKFRQAENSTKRKFGGTGLGLAITKQLVELQGGKLEVESELGKGTTFSFQMKFGIAEAPQKKADESESKKIEIDGLRILLAEDIELNQYLMKEVMRPFNVELSIAANGNEVLEEMKSGEFDVLLLDMHMPERNGIETATAIRAKEVEQSDIHIIALTADVFVDTREAMMKAGVNDFLSKPINTKELFKKLSQLKRA